MESNKNSTIPEENPLKEPYPIMARYVRWIIPMLLIFVAVLVVTTALATQTAQEKIYLHLASIRAKGIAEGVKRIVPAQWSRLLAGEPLDKEDLEALRVAFEDECQEFRVSKLKVYDLSRQTIFSTDSKDIGTIEEGANLRAVIETAEERIATEHDEGGEPFYELYVPLEIDGRMRVVFELYEPVTFLNAILSQAIKPIIIYPFLFLFLLTISQGMIMRRAQADIDHRTRMINLLQGRLESLVSRSAVSAVHRVVGAGEIPSEQLECTLFYSDIRSFTSFSEQNEPAEVVAFLNEIMELQVDAIHHCGGDVDKMIGDAVLARFQGADREKQAVSAAVEIQTRLKKAAFPRGIGIGIYSGSVIAGGIGPKNRQDYTIIGDAVNVSARLCSLAESGEVVVDIGTLDRAAVPGFSHEQKVSVKGRKGELTIRKKAV